jgi:chromosome segregation ATPase
MATDEISAGNGAGTAGTVDAALERLSRAISRLEAAVEHRLEADQSVDGLEAAVQRLGEDRSRLAATLDTSEARVARLEDANREVSRRLVSAMESIRSVLETHGG